MSEPINQKILSNYDTYRKVRYEEKVVEDETIILTEKKNNINYKQGTSKVQSNFLSDIMFIAEAHKTKAKNYGLKLRSKSISEKPFFRFDASGCAHNNKSPEIPLPLRQITTPHFQYYNELGFNTAYKTEELKDQNVVLNIESDMNIGVKLFCDESFTFTKDKGYPKIIRDNGLLFKTEAKDPLKNIDFDESF